MSEFVVHTIPGSPFARAVFATLEEKSAPYRIAPVAPGSHKSPEHLARHPFGRVPVLEHDGLVLYETAAILRYLDRVLPDPRLTPADARRAARMDQLMNINDWYLFQALPTSSSSIACSLHGWRGSRPTRLRLPKRCRRRAPCSASWRACLAISLISPATAFRWPT